MSAEINYDEISYNQFRIKYVRVCVREREREREKERVWVIACVFQREKQKKKDRAVWKKVSMCVCVCACVRLCWRKKEGERESGSEMWSLLFSKQDSLRFCRVEIWQFVFAHLAHGSYQLREGKNSHKNLAKILEDSKNCFFSSSIDQSWQVFCIWFRLLNSNFNSQSCYKKSN